MTVQIVQSVAQKANEEIAAAREAAKEAMDSSYSANASAGSKRKERKERGENPIDQYEEEGLQLWTQAKQKVFQPGVAGGLLGVGASFRFELCPMDGADGNRLYLR